MKKTATYFKIAGFTFIEVIVVIAIIGVLATIVLVTFSGVQRKARDARRKTEISQIGKFLTLSCYLPDEGEGEYDLVPLVEEIVAKYPQYVKYLSNIPKDPKTGTDIESKYIYIISAADKKCALYANLENINELVTLSITEATPGGGIGVFKAETSGWNGTLLYFQYSN